MFLVVKQDCDLSIQCSYSHCFFECTYFRSVFFLVLYQFSIYGEILDVYYLITEYATRLYAIEYIALFPHSERLSCITSS